MRWEAWNQNTPTGGPNQRRIERIEALNAERDQLRVDNGALREALTRSLRSESASNLLVPTTREITYEGIPPGLPRIIRDLEAEIVLLKKEQRQLRRAVARNPGSESASNLPEIPLPTTTVSSPAQGHRQSPSHERSVERTSKGLEQNLGGKRPS